MLRIAQALAAVLVFSVCTASFAGEANQSPSRNKPERLAWFQDLALGMFVHWGVDVQLGCVISHSMVGASDEYLERYIAELPRTFEPKRSSSPAIGRASLVSRACGTPSSRPSTTAGFACLTPKRPVST